MSGDHAGTPGVSGRCGEGWVGGPQAWARLAAAAAASALLEAVTAQSDNVFVPLHYYAALTVVGF